MWTIYLFVIKFLLLGVIFIIMILINVNAIL